MFSEDEGKPKSNSMRSIMKEINDVYPTKSRNLEDIACG